MDLIQCKVQFRDDLDLHASNIYNHRIMNKKKITSLFLFLVFLCLGNAYSQCVIEVNSGGFEYTVDIDIEVTDAIYTQMGSTCNVELVVEYDVQIDIVNQPGWWNESLYVLQGDLNCVGGSGASFFDLPLTSGSGTVTSATFSYTDEMCADVILDCPITISIQGPELNYEGECGSFQQSTLPVALSGFSSRTNADQQVEIFWTSASEINFSHYELETLSEFDEWTLIKSIPGNNAPQGSDYETMLPTSATERYLRLKMVDLDGSFEYSNILHIHPHQSENVTIYPNPATDKLYFSRVTTDKISIFNNVGAEVRANISSNNSIDISSLQAGYYTIILNNQSEVITKRFIKI